MAEQDKDSEKEPVMDLAADAAPSRPKLTAGTLVALVNSLMIVAALGTLVYTKLLYKKPVIDETSELKRRQEELKQPPELSNRVIVPFDQLRVNIAMTSGKAHYATLSFSVETRDSAAADLVKAKHDLLLDKLISALGRRQMSELNTIQGKLVLKSELLREFNALTEPAAVTDVYFSNFVLQ